MKIKIGVSARHVHLCKKDFEYLFEKDALTKYCDLSQPGNYAAEEKVSLVTENGRIDNVRIVGELRNYTQVEITKTDSYKLKINPPVRGSGDLDDASDIWIEANGKRILARNSCIIANRHIHIRNDELDKYGFVNNQKVLVKISSEKGGILDNVFIKASKEATFEMHLDLDDANANLVSNGDFEEIIDYENR